MVPILILVGLWVYVLVRDARKYSNNQYASGQLEARRRQAQTFNRFISYGPRPKRGK